MARRITLLTETGVTEADEAAVGATDGLWLTAADAERATGWTLKPEGMCQGPLCVPLPADTTRNGSVDVAAFWRRLDRPVVRDSSGGTWMLGAGADERNAALAGQVAPDFTLPDLAGVAHRLSDLRGRKVFLTTWASW